MKTGIHRQLTLLNEEAARRARTFSSEVELADVTGGGKVGKPDYALVFINPTIRNTSTKSHWNGIRHPWIGTRPVWGVLKRGGLLRQGVFDEIPDRNGWDEAFAARVYAGVAKDGIYITNLVKWTGHNGDLPSSRMVRAFSELTIRELEIVAPRAVICFGAIPFKALGGGPIRLMDILDLARSGMSIPAVPMGDTGIPMYPCFFPVGRGNPSAAIEVLQAIVRQQKRGISQSLLEEKLVP